MMEESNKKGVFVVGTDGSMGAGDLTMCETFQELNEYLKSLRTDIDEGTMVLHGMVTSARYIPADVGSNVYVVVQDPSHPGSGCIYETEYPDSRSIETMITNFIKRGDEYYDHISIDNVFIVYGYELTLGFSADEEELDEEAFGRCEMIANNVKDITEADLTDMPIDEEDALFALYGQVVGKCE